MAFIRCPADGGELESDSELVVEGQVGCRVCGRKYRVSDGILELLIDRERLDDATAAELTARDAEASQYDSRFSPERNAMELPDVRAAAGALAGKAVLEVGCGTGRLTHDIAAAARVVIAMDLSRSSLLVLARKLSAARVALVQADARYLPITSRSVDVAVSLQVLEHVTPRDGRVALLRHLSRALRPGGIAVLTAYHHDLGRRLRRLAQDGSHPSGVPYHFFARRELESELATAFQSYEVRHLQIVLPGSSRLGLPVVAISRLLQRAPVIRELAHLLLARAVNGPTNPAG